MEQTDEVSSTDTDGQRTPALPFGPAPQIRYQPAKSRWNSWRESERPGRNIANNDATRLPNQRPG